MELSPAGGAVGWRCGREPIEREFLERDRTRSRRGSSVRAVCRWSDRLASGIAHNFQQHNRAILGYSEMVEPQLAPGSKPAQHVDEIRRAAERGRDLIDASSRSGGACRRVQPISGPSLFESRLAAARRIASRRRARHRGRHRRHRRVRESAQLQQVILNLCTNAAQAMDGHGRVHVTAGQRAWCRACC